MAHPLVIATFMVIALVTIAAWRRRSRRRSEPSVKTDPFADSILEGTRERYARFARLFRLQGDVGDLVNRVLDEEGAKIKIRDGEDRLLSVIIGPLLGKAMKTSRRLSECACSATVRMPPCSFGATSTCS